MHHDMEEVLEILSELLNGLEYAVQNARAQLAALVKENVIPEAEKAVDKRVWGWNPDAVKWAEATGPSGEYQLATLENNHDNRDFREMLRDLEEHDGRLSREGWFYWRFQQKTSVGRKKRT